MNELNYFIVRLTNRAAVARGYSSQSISQWEIENITSTGSYHWIRLLVLCGLQEKVEKQLDHSARWDSEGG